MHCICSKGKTQNWNINNWFIKPTRAKNTGLHSRQHLPLKEVSVLNITLGAVRLFSRQASQVFPVPEQPLLVFTSSATDALNAYTYLFNLPATGVFPKFVNKPAAVNSFQDLPLIVVPEREGSVS